MKTTNQTTPKLRFPEFSGEWSSQKLLNLADGGLSNGVFNDPSKVGYGYKLINVIDMYLETFVNESQLSLVGISESEFQKNKVQHGDLFFTRSSLVKAGIAQSNIYLGSSDDITFDGHLIRLRPNQLITIPLFLHYVLKTESAREQLVSKGKTATMTTIGQSDVGSTIVFIPSTREQQKIADCLSSLDDLITAENKKLDALKTHKKGLMQQLFPAEGETVPRLRFPEFSGDWEEALLGVIANNISSGKDKLDPEGRYELYGSTGIIGKSSNESYNGKYILVARVGANAGFLTKVNGCFGVTDNTIVVDIKDGNNIDFCYFNLSNLRLSKLVFGSGQPLITGSQLKNLSIRNPKLPEQQKIADFLSSVDEFISAQIKKIDALKTHKKGLMQQLFPVLSH